MKTEFRVSSFEPPSLRYGAPGSRVRRSAGSRHSSFVIQHLRNAFTLIELLVVIAIIVILAALLAPTLKGVLKPNATVAATRQMLDDVARARQLAISERSTVFMVFVPTNFWNDPLKKSGLAQWGNLPLPIQNSTVVTQLYAAQWNGYMMVSLRDVGDQPGRAFPKDLVRVKTLPQGSFFAPFKFANSPSYPAGDSPAYVTNRPDLPIYVFPTTNAIPFPTSDVMTNAAFVNLYKGGNGNIHFVTVPYIAFNYLGQLITADGTVLPYDENIPLAYGSIAQAINPTNKSPIQGVPTIIESPESGSTNSAYNVIHIDRMTGRARLERQDAL
jgi:prepilin-type N-terminal cleavage/methylation domain-containing protein